MMISAPSSGLSATHPRIENRIDAIVEYAAQNLKGLKLAPAAARVIPRNDDQEFKAGFSISHMKYPAWISKPIIVMPSLVTGGLLFLLSHYGLSWLLSMISQTPDVVLSVYNVDIHANGNDLRGTFSSTDQGRSFWEEFGPRDIKIMLLEMLPGIPLIIGARYLVKTGIGKNNSLIRHLAGLPSKEMASDWDDESESPKLKINIADTRAIVQTREVQNNLAPPVQRSDYRPVFGKATNKL